jgi:glucosamine-6-phosphate deaminase
VGGVDLQILGIGRTGHIGFNEPGSSKDSLTRRITLDRITRQDAASDFRGEENVPHFAITMGVGTILRAKKLVLMAWGENKAAIVARAVEGVVTDAISASFLQDHADARFFIDEGASRELTRFKLPWLVGSVEWSAAEARRGVCWLSAKLNRPVLKLVDEDYNEHGLSDLLSDHGPAYQLNIRIFNQLQHTITGWPGGKPGADDTSRPECAQPFPKRCLIFSPEPQDALVAMGGTIDRLREQGHEVHIISMTSGSLRVSDSEADKFASTLSELGMTSGDAVSWAAQTDYAQSILKIIMEKGEFGEDPPELRALKGLILRGELRHAANALGLASERVVFLDLPFYEQGRYRRFSSTAVDAAAVASLLKQYAPHQIYLTGDAADPSSVSAICYKLITTALKEGTSCSAWLYRGKEKALAPHEISMAVPMAPMQMERKLRAYDELGLAEYEAMECFQRWS